VTSLSNRIQAFRSLSLVRRTLVTTFALVILCAAFLSAMSAVAIAATRAIFPPPGTAESSANVEADGTDVEKLASQGPAGESDDATRPKAKSKPGKRVASARGDNEE
jgi:P pilus assembly chaperone PapD